MGRGAGGYYNDRGGCNADYHGVPLNKILAGRTLHFLVPLFTRLFVSNILCRLAVEAKASPPGFRTDRLSRYAYDGVLSRRISVVSWNFGRTGTHFWYALLVHLEVGCWGLLSCDLWI